MDEGGTDVHAMGFEFTKDLAKEKSYPRFPSWLIFDEHVRTASSVIGHCPGIIQEDPTFDDVDSVWWLDEHCVVMYASDGENVYISDPLAGLVVHERDSFKDVFEKCGSYALYMR